jgi:hypothetical protein
MLTQEDIEELNKQKLDDNQNNNEYDNDEIDKLEKLIEQLTEEEIKGISDNIEKKPKARLIKKETIDDKPKGKLIKKDKKVENISALITDDIKNKYKQRQTK